MMRSPEIWTADVSLILLSKAIRNDTDARTLTRELTTCYGKAFARRLVDTALAVRWLTDGFPIADVLTMLEVRHRFDLPAHFARAYAVDILAAATAEIDQTIHPQIANQKETENAIA
jgi:hypothetical protein